jgi:phosphatidylserine decarboxylase
MTLRNDILRLFEQEDINFLLTNRVPRRLLTRFVGWFSKIEQPVIRDLSIAVWRFFTKLDLTEAKKSHFRSMHDCFTRELKEGARPINEDVRVLTSPCDGIVGAIGHVEEDSVLQAKGLPYRLIDLLGDPELVRYYARGSYATLRLTSGMYHRFHAPHDCCVEQVNYISGDTWNVNPIALKRVENLFCRNERAIIRCRLQTTGDLITLVPVAAILVASIRLHFLDILLHLKYRGPNVIECDHSLLKGQEMGWFQHGSTILVFAPEGFCFGNNIHEGAIVRVGQPLFTAPAQETAATSSDERAT